jgi:hypothetical protein
MMEVLGFDMIDVIVAGRHISVRVSVSVGIVW